MKLKPRHIIGLLIGIIIISCFLGRSVYEGLTDGTGTGKGAGAGAGTGAGTGAGAGTGVGTYTGDGIGAGTVMGAFADAGNQTVVLGRRDEIIADASTNKNLEADKIINWFKNVIENSNSRHPKNTNNNDYDKQYSGDYGVYKEQIPSGDEDLYILKSQIVPPVCPACPSNTSCGSKEPPQPCPACARCPESAFECKKVPNYRSGDSNNIPRPVLTDFSSFGM